MRRWPMRRYCIKYEEANSMTKKDDGNLSGGSEASRRSLSKKEDSPQRVRLPEFITEEEIGLGDMVKRTTSYLGIKPCGGCEKRATALNIWLVFTRRRSWQIRFFRIVFQILSTINTNT